MLSARVYIVNYVERIVDFTGIIVIQYECTIRDDKQRTILLLLMFVEILSTMFIFVFNILENF